MTFPSNYSDKEIYNLTGTLPADRIEKLIDVGNLAEKLASAVSSAEEASGCYMPEDFLADQLNELQSILKGLRGDNRRRLSKVIEDIEQNISMQVNEGEYGRDVLRNMLKD